MPAWAPVASINALSATSPSSAEVWTRSGSRAASWRSASSSATIVQSIAQDADLTTRVDQGCRDEVDRDGPPRARAEEHRVDRAAPVFGDRGQEDLVARLRADARDVRAQDVADEAADRDRGRGPVEALRRGVPGADAQAPVRDDDRVVGRDEQRIGGDPVEIDGRRRQRSSPWVETDGRSGAGILPPGSERVTPLGRVGADYVGWRRQGAGGRPPGRSPTRSGWRAIRRVSSRSGNSPRVPSSGTRPSATIGRCSPGWGRWV